MVVLPVGGPPFYYYRRYEVVGIVQASYFFLIFISFYLLAFVVHIPMCFMPRYFKTVCWAPTYKWRYSLLFSPQDHSFAATSTPLIAAEGRNDLRVGSAIGPPSTTVNPAEDFWHFFRGRISRYG